MNKRNEAPRAKAYGFQHQLHKELNPDHASEVLSRRDKNLFRKYIKIFIYNIFAVMFLIVGCNSEESNDPKQPNQKTSGLNRVQSHEELESYIKQAVIYQIEDYSYYCNGDQDAFADEMPPSQSPSEPSSHEASDNYSTTNIQESGVDEADFVKNDGKYIYILNGNYFLIYSATPPEETHEISRIEIEGNSTEMFVGNNFVGDNMAVIFSNVWETIPSSDINDPDYYRFKITILDLIDKTEPKLVRETYFEGNYNTARLVDNAVHVVVSSYLKTPRMNYCDSSKNREIIEQTPLDDFIPKFNDIIYQGEKTKSGLSPISGYENFYIANKNSGDTIISILSLDLENPLEAPNEASILSSAGNVYVSSDNVYLTYTNYDDFYTTLSENNSMPQEKTEIHKFDIHSIPTQAVYVASGKVDGWVLNQFSMDEEDGFFRIATTEENICGMGECIGEMCRIEDCTKSNNLFVLEENDGNLEVVGEVRDIAPTEEIYSARFLGDIGFMVTYKKIDPLFTFDLSNPYNPQLVGELEVPGFSSYIHPASNENLITIGKDTDDMGSFAWFQGIQISIYDVSELSDPKLTQMEVIGSRGTSSEALYDHKAFNYFSSKKILAFPIKLYEGGNGGPEYGELTFAGFQVYGVDLNEGFTLLGQIDHNEFNSESCHYYYSGYCYPQMRRTIIIDDSIYTISSAGMKVNSLDDLSIIQSSIKFP